MKLEEGLIMITKLEYSRMIIKGMINRDNNIRTQEGIIIEMINNKGIIRTPGMIIIEMDNKDLDITLEMITAEMTAGMNVETNEETNVEMIVGTIVEKIAETAIKDHTITPTPEMITEETVKVTKDLLPTQEMKITIESVNKDLVMTPEKTIPTKDHIKELDKKKLDLKNKFNNLNYRMGIFNLVKIDLI